MKKKDTIKTYSKSYTKNIYSIMIIASLSISLAVIITGVLGYSSTKSSLIKKAKSQDIVYIVKSMASKIDGRISRAMETSYIFARDPSNIEWVSDEEKNKELGKTVLKKVNDIADTYDYSNFFITGVKTKHYYYAEKSTNKHSDESYAVLSESNKADKWFYNFLAAKKGIELNVDYNRLMDNYYLFINVVMGKIDNPAGICGVGLSLNDIAKEFREFKFGEKSNLWMIDEKGTIQLSDKRTDIGKTYGKLLPKDVINQIKNQTKKGTENINVAQYVNSNKETIDYAYCKLSSCNWILFYQIPRNESISLISSLKANTIVTVAIVLICFVILFYFVSKKIANPYKQAMLMNKELESKVNIRTQELKESNQKIIDSIEYAKRLQESILPSKPDMEKTFKDSCVIWRPRDIVGGDFFWFREIGDTIVLAIGDCTGHGVPGALMTMTVNAILHNIVTTVNKDDPSVILKLLHSKLREALNKTSNPQSADDGLDIAVFCIKNKTTLLYAGANIALYIKKTDGVTILNPQSKGIGYSYIEINNAMCSESIIIDEDDIFIASTDGFLHQNGGQKNYPFGKKRLYNMINECTNTDLCSMQKEFEDILEEYMNGNEQRDDITVLGFKVK